MSRLLFEGGIQEIPRRGGEGNGDEKKRKEVELVELLEGTLWGVVDMWEWRWRLLST